LPINSDIDIKESEIETNRSEVDKEIKLEIDIIESDIKKLVTSETNDKSF
ncbi:6511_t:CDS:1, partial [Funneliformis geosporum]